MKLIKGRDWFWVMGYVVLLLGFGAMGCIGSEGPKFEYYMEKSFLTQTDRFREDCISNPGNTPLAARVQNELRSQRRAAGQKGTFYVNQSDGWFKIVDFNPELAKTSLEDLDTLVRRAQFTLRGLESWTRQNRAFAAYIKEDSKYPEYCTSHTAGSVIRVKTGTRSTP
jgi:hypothetical protein